MKIAILFFLAVGLAGPVRAQDDAISRYFSQYSDNDDFTSVYVSSRMFSLFSRAVEDDPEDRELKRAISKLKGLRILSSDKMRDGRKMYQEAARTILDRGTEYEELMVVKSEGQELKFLVVESGDKIKELLMLSGGGNDFLMLSLIGDIDLKQISRLSKSMDVKGLENLEKLDQNDRKK
ncbi:MAG: DUF4252 domain-containing protein [Ferruginibacter sp.]|nr:DUF4252 domain-containing protein [Cytophagales bacterium]